MSSKKYQQLKDQFRQIGMVIPGTLRTLYLRCGKKTCKCDRGQLHDRHGPYVFWDRTVKGQLSSQSIDPKDRKIFQQWINNRKTLESVCKKMLALGLNIASVRKKRT